ncbi:MAG: hypothetical protein ABJA94_11025 [Rhodoglobus sp.]
MTNPESPSIIPSAPTQSSVPPKAPRNVPGLISLIVSIVGFVFACIPGALILGWILLPIAFILAIVSLFMRGVGKGFGVAGLIISVVGTIVGFIVFFAVAASSFSDAFGGGTTVVGSSGSSTSASDSSTSKVGTRDNPAAVGSTITGKDWTAVVNSYNTDGNAIVLANSFNEAPAAGNHYELVNYTVTYTGADSSYAASVAVSLVTSSGNVVNSFDHLVILDDSMGLAEMFKGGSATGSVAFLVPDGQTALVRVRPGIIADEAFIKP